VTGGSVSPLNQRMLFWLFCAAVAVAANEEPAKAAHLATSRRDTLDLLATMGVNF
jgi:hypothetical protein